MPVEFIGMISTRDQSETRRASGPVIDRDYLRRFARAHEDAGFDRVLIGYGSSQPDGTQVAAYAAAQTDRLGFLIAHRPGFVFPTLAARTFATLDQFAGGRIAVHIITGGSDGGATPRRRLPRQGRALRPDRRVPRHPEASVDVRRAVRLRRPVLPARGLLRRRPVAAAAADPALLRRVFRRGLPGRRQARRRLRTVGRAARRDRRADRLGPGSRPRPPAGPTAPGISVSFRPILGPTEDLAWERAHRILETTQRTWALSGVSGGGRRLAWVAPDPRTWGRSGCWPPRRRGSFTTEPSGLLWPPPRAPPETPPLWSVRPRRSLKPSSTMSTSASRRCSSAATTPTTTPSTTGATCSRSSGTRSPAVSAQPQPRRSRPAPRPE